MKAIKLVAIFCLVAGGILLALNLGSIISPTKSDDYPAEDLIDISEKCDEIRKAWAACSGWDERVYKSQRDDIDQSKGLGMFSKEGYNTVNNCLRENATNKACDSYLAVLHSSSFKAGLLQDCYAGVESIKRHESLDNESRIQNVENLHRLYTNIQKFVSSSHPITPKFDSDNGTWTAFTALQNGVLATARKYRNDALYKEMSHIPGFQDGLNESYLTKTTNAQRENFYESLSRQIVQYFDSEEPTDEKIKSLEDIYKEFLKQEENYGVSQLAKFKVDYKKTE